MLQALAQAVEVHLHVSNEISFVTIKTATAVNVVRKRGYNKLISFFQCGIRSLIENSLTTNICFGEKVAIRAGQIYLIARQQALLFDRQKVAVENLFLVQRGSP